MGASWWGQVGQPLLIGVASSTVFAALCFLSVRLWNCLMKRDKTQKSTAGERAPDQTRPDGDAAAPANGVRDLEMANGYGPGACGHSMAEPESELEIVNSGEGIATCMEHFSDQDSDPSVIGSPLTTSGQDDSNSVATTTRVASASTTVFVNKTGHVVTMKVGNNQHFSDLASIQDGGEYKLVVDMNDTYREFAFCFDESSKKEIVSSDDCCEFQCITIQERADGKLELLRQARESISGSSSAANGKKPSWFHRWM